MCFWLCVPDAAIAQVTRRLVKRVGERGLQGQIVVHSSGALSANVLREAAHAGASVARVHPVMSFPTRTPVPLEGVPFGVEADASQPPHSQRHRSPDRRPSICHQGREQSALPCVGVLSSPLLVSHLAAAQQTASLAGFNSRQARQLIEPIARATLDNYFLRGARQSFSGPIARGRRANNSSASSGPGAPSYPRGCVSLPGALCALRLYPLQARKSCALRSCRK